jgi:hypothetical protein
MKRMALFLFFLLVVSGCELGTDAVDDSDYWWLDDPRFAEVLDQIDVKASLPLEEFGMVFLKPQSYSGEEARKRFIDRYGSVGYHLMVWHPKIFDTMIQEHNGNLDFLKQEEGEPEPNVVDEYECEPCPFGTHEYCDEGGGSGGPPPPPPNPPFVFQGSTWVIPSTMDPNVTTWQVDLEAYTNIISNHWADIKHRSCFQRDGASTECNYNPGGAPAGGPTVISAKNFTTTLSVYGTGIICPHTFSGYTDHYAKITWTPWYGSPQHRAATGGPYCS